MSLFRRVTRYRISPTQNPRENRLTEVTSAVLERVDGLALDVMDAVLASAATNANERRFDAVDEVESARLELACDSLAVQLKRLRELDRPRLRVDTQVTTASTKFVDLQMVFSPRPFEPGDKFVFWVEVKHGANVHGTQLADYEADIKVADADHRLVIVLAPRQDVGALVGVPDLMPVVEWQAVADVVRRWTKRPGISDVERFLLTDYLAYLQEEGLMEQELLTAEHAFVLGAAPAAMNTVANVVKLADAAIAGAWGGRQSAKTRGTKPAYGLDYWGHYGPPATGGAPAPASWRSANLIWGLGGDQDRAEPRDAYVFYAGATFQASRENPAAVAENGDWLAARRTHGFEYVYYEDYWQLLRFKYPEELLAATTPDEQTQTLAGWVIESFRLLANTPPPN